jgi:hypothetical protein
MADLVCTSRTEPLKPITDKNQVGAWWLTPVIPAIQEAETGRMEVEGQRTKSW